MKKLVRVQQSIAGEAGLVEKIARIAVALTVPLGGHSILRLPY